MISRRTIEFDAVEQQDLLDIFPPEREVLSLDQTGL